VHAGVLRTTQVSAQPADMWPSEGGVSLKRFPEALSSNCDEN